jgi:hypothetical protein
MRISGDSELYACVPCLPAMDVIKIEPARIKHGPLRHGGSIILREIEREAEPHALMQHRRAAFKER